MTEECIKQKLRGFIESMGSDKVEIMGGIRQRVSNGRIVK